MAARDILLVGVLIFTFAIGFFTIHYTVNTTVDQLIAEPSINESAAATETMTVSKTISNRLDYVIFGLFIALVLGVIITGWFVGGNPIFMFIYFIVVVIAVVLGMIFSNVWTNISESSIFGTTVTYFTITNNIMVNLPIYLAIIGIIGLVVMFAKPYVVGQQE